MVNKKPVWGHALLTLLSLCAFTPAVHSESSHYSESSHSKSCAQSSYAENSQSEGQGQSQAVQYLNQGGDQQQDQAQNQGRDQYLHDVEGEGVYTWSPDQLPLRVYFEDDANVPGYKKKFPKIVAGCFSEWSIATGGRIKWHQVDSPDQANVIVHWSDKAVGNKGATEAGRTKTMARLNSLTHKGTIYKADMNLLTRLPDREFSCDEIQKAYLHEVGHALGLAGHSGSCGDIMFYSISRMTTSNLSNRDRATINMLYGTAPTAIEKTQLQKPERAS